MILYFRHLETCFFDFDYITSVIVHVGLHTDIGRIVREIAPCDIVMADIDADVLDSRVLAFEGIVRAILAEMGSG